MEGDVVGICAHLVWEEVYVETIVKPCPNFCGQKPEILSLVRLETH